MTEPQPVMAQAEQDQLTRQVGRALLTVAGADWQQVRAEYRSAGRHIEVDVFVKGADGVERQARPPQEVVDGFGRLRQGMYRPGRGTWLSALYVLDPPSSFSAEFEPDVEPRWRRVPPPIGFADELRFFPREDDHIPDWLRQRAGLPPLQEAEAPARPGMPGGQRPPRPQGPPTPPPGMPTPHGGVPASPPRGFTAPGRQGEPTPQYGIPAGPHTDRGAPPPQHGMPTPPPGPYTSQATPPRGERVPHQGAPSDHRPPPPRGEQAPGPFNPTPPGISIPAGPFTGPAQPPAGGTEPAHTPPRGAEEPANHDNNWGPR
ncbi:hypothetical protein [Actinophytocola sp.]|uniref:hypothetical protein n=1 Tax=Actinophytocola sp. TaxID=1872138 RepID=UPI002ECFCB5C